MALSKNNPTTQKSWKSLEKIYEQENGLKILDYLNSPDQTDYNLKQNTQQNELK